MINGSWNIYRRAGRGLTIGATVMVTGGRGRRYREELRHILKLMECVTEGDKLAVLRFGPGDNDGEADSPACPHTGNFAGKGGACREES